MNLEVGTSNQAEISELWIAGSVMNLMSLAGLIDQNVKPNMVGRCIALRSSFSPMAPYELILDVRDDAFDPASADPTC